MLANLNVYKENMLSNIWKTNGVIFSQNILVKLIEKGLSREESYKMVQDLAFQSWNNDKNFKDLLLGDPKIMKILNKKELENCFAFNNLYKNAQIILARVIK